MSYLRPAADTQEPVYLSLEEIPEEALDYRDGEVFPSDEGDDSAREHGLFGAAPMPPIAAVPRRPAAKVVPFYGIVRRGSPRSKRNRAYKRALSHAGSMKWGHFDDRANIYLDRAVRNFQRKHGLHVDGVIGRETHRKLAPHFDRYALKYLWKSPPPRLSREDRVRHGIVADAYLGYRNRAAMHYTQGSLRTFGWHIPFPQIITWADCSAWLIGIHKRAGSWFWRQLGTYTGTLREHGHRTTNPKPGDDCEYGPGTGRHVSVVVAVGKRLLQIGFGSESGPSLGTVFYRSDFNGFRTHF